MSNIPLKHVVLLMQRNGYGHSKNLDYGWLIPTNKSTLVVHPSKFNLPNRISSPSNQSISTTSSLLSRALPTNFPKTNLNSRLRTLIPVNLGVLMPTSHQPHLPKRPRTCFPFWRNKQGTKCTRMR